MFVITHEDIVWSAWKAKEEIITRKFHCSNKTVKFMLFYLILPRAQHRSTHTQTRARARIFSRASAHMHSKVKQQCNWALRLLLHSLWKYYKCILLAFFKVPLSERVHILSQRKYLLAMKNHCGTETYFKLNLPWLKFAEKKRLFLHTKANVEMEIIIFPGISDQY